MTVLSYKLILDVVGRTRRDKAYRTLLAAAAEEPVISHLSGTPVTEYCFHQHGFSLTSIRGKSGFRLADLFIAEHNEFSGYAGALPYGLKSSDKREDVLRRLGAPIESGQVRRNIPVAPSLPDEEWKAYLDLQSSQPFTNEWCVYDVDDGQMRLWFDKDRDGRMVCIVLTKPRIET